MTIQPAVMNGVYTTTYVYSPVASWKKLFSSSSWDSVFVRKPLYHSK